MLLKAGDKLGPYEILSALGAGGMGEVYPLLDERTPDVADRSRSVPASRIALRLD